MRRIGVFGFRRGRVSGLAKPLDLGELLARHEWTLLGFYQRAHGLAEHPWAPPAPPTLLPRRA